MSEGQKCSEGHKVFKLVGEQINAKPEVAYLIWNSWRNGLLHRAMQQTIPPRVPNQIRDFRLRVDLLADQFENFVTFGTLLTFAHISVNAMLLFIVIESD